MKTTAKEFSEMFAKLCAAYPRIDPSESTMVVYYERLGNFKPDDVASAVDKAIDSCEFFPSISWLIESIRQAPQPRRKLLDEPLPTPEQQKKNLEIIREMTTRLSKKMAVGK